MASVVSPMDDLVKDYLLFRGFGATLKSLDTEVKADKDRGLRAEKIMELLHSYVSSYEIGHLRDFWLYLDTRYFSRLEQVYMSSVKKLEVSLFRWYVINAVQTNKNDKVVEFFEKMASDCSQSEWRDWFILPFIKNPEDVPTFTMYFSKQWQDTFLLSLHNFLSVIFQSMPLPSLLMFDDDLKRMKKLQMECDYYKKQMTLNSTETADFVVDRTQIPDKKAKQIVQYNPLELVDDFYDKSTNEASAGGVEEESKGKGVRKFLVKIGNPSSPTTKPRNATVSVPQPPPVKTQKSKDGSKPLATRSSTKTYKKITTDSIKVKEDSKPVVSQKEELPVRDLGVPESDTSKPYILISQDEYGDHHSAITHCRFSDTGKHVASSDMDGVVKIWGLSPTPVTLATIMSKASIMCFEWASKNDRLILLGNKASQLKLYDIKEKRNIIDVSLDSSYPRITTLLSNPTGTSFACAAMSKGGGYLSEKSPRSGKLSLWNLKSMERDRDINTGPSSSAVTAMAFNHNGQLLLVGTTSGSIRLYDVQTTNCIASWNGHQGDVYTIQFSFDESTCYSLGADGRFLQWSIRNNGALQHEYNFHKDIAGPFSTSSFTGQKTVVTPRGRLFACDGDRQCALTCRGNSGVIYSLTDTLNDKPMIVLNGHRSPVITVDWSSAQDSRSCLTGSMDGKILLSTLLK